MSDWASQFEESYVTNGDLKLHYVASGPSDGEPVLLLHGFPEFSYEWRRHIPALAAQGYRVVAPDLRGYNLSDRPAGVEAYRMQNLVGDIGAFYRQFGWSSANIVAHDWGGAISWLFVTFYPQLVRRFVVLDVPHPTAFRTALQTPAQINLSWYIWFFQSAGVAEKVFGPDLSGILNYLMRDQARPGTFSEADFGEYLTTLSQPGAFEATLNYYRANTTQATVYSASSTQFPPIQPPTLLIYGQQDFGFTPLAWQETAKYCAGSFQSVGLEGIGHWSVEEAPAETLRLISEHLQRPLD